MSDELHPKGKAHLTEEQLKELLDSELDEDVPESLIDVEGASGAKFTVHNEKEADWFNENMARYQDEYAFGNVSDLQDLDRLLGLELLGYRYSLWMLRGVDYDNLLFDEKAVRDHKAKIDVEIRLTKSHMGMDRKGRIDAEQQSSADYLKNVLHRAKGFGVHRNEQVAKAIDLFEQLSSMIGLGARADEEERHHLQVSDAEVVAWVRDVAIPEYRAIDDAFRKEQRYWIREVSHVPGS